MASTVRFGGISKETKHEPAGKLTSTATSLAPTTPLLLQSLMCYTRLDIHAFLRSIGRVSGLFDGDIQVKTHSIIVQLQRVLDERVVQVRIFIFVVIHNVVCLLA